MEQFRPLDTIYNGYRFRSRLEARWAVFFDEMGIKYTYEPQGYELPPFPEDADYIQKPSEEFKKITLTYLPDFYFDDLDIYAEVKGREPSFEEDEKAYRLAHYTRKRVAILGEIPNPDKYGFGGFQNMTQYKGYVHFQDLSWDNDYLFCQCSYCDAIGFEYSGRAERIKCCDANKSNNDKRYYNFDTTKLLNAYAKARQARFEHGERP